MNIIKFIEKIIVYSYIYNNDNYNNSNFIKDLILFSKTICRQNPYLILNKKKEILGVKNTLRNKNLNNFLCKLIYFILPKIKKDIIIDDNIFKLDNNYNINFILKNKSYFFEYKTNLSSTFNYPFCIKLIFKNNINYIDKINYIKNFLNIELK